MKFETDGYCLLWSWLPKEPHWKHVATIGINGCGHLEPNDHVSSDRYSYDEWLRTSDPEDEDHKPEPIMGRAVTMWDVHHGVRLIGFEPPQYCKWLGVSAYEHIQKSPIWYSLIAGGGTLLFDSVEHVKQKISLS